MTIYVHANKTANYDTMCSFLQSYHSDSEPLLGVNTNKDDTEVVIKCNNITSAEVALEGWSVDVINVYTKDQHDQVKVIVNDANWKTPFVF